MKRRNPVACDQARQINATHDRPIDHLDNDTLDGHLENVYLFKLGLRNSFGVDFRNQSHFVKTPDGQTAGVLFNYLSEVIPLVQPQADRMPPMRIAAYNRLADDAIHSFWEIYYRFQPLIRHLADKNGIEIDDLGNVLGRAILLFDRKRGFKFFSYLDKTLRESIKNLRGQILAQQYQLPLSAGRLMPQLLWAIDQESLRRGRGLSIEEGESVVMGFLCKQSARFSRVTRQRIARAAINQTGPLPLDFAIASDSQNAASPSPIHAPNDSSVDRFEAKDEHEHLLGKVAQAVDRAQLTDRERAILLQRLELTYDEDIFTRAESELTEGSLRNRRAQLMVRFIAAFHAGDAKRFGRFLLADPVACKPMLTRQIQRLAEQLGTNEIHVIGCLLNHLALSNRPYRISITQRGQLESYLRAHPHAPLTKISGQLFHKFKAGLIDQDRQGFPCIVKQIAD